MRIRDEEWKPNTPAKRIVAGNASDARWREVSWSVQRCDVGQAQHRAHMASLRACALQSKEG